MRAIILIAIGLWFFAMAVYGWIVEGYRFEIASFFIASSFVLTIIGLRDLFKSNKHDKTKHKQ